MLARKIAEYACSLEYNHLNEEVVRELKRRVIDTIGVSFAALDAQPVRIARDYAAFSSSRYGATVFGSFMNSNLEDAVFVNGCAARYLDFNDTYLSREAIHPSDNIPAILAVAEAEGASGREFLLGCAVAYEVACRLADAASIRDRGWDHVTYIAISSAVGAAKVMALDVEKTVQAINLAATPNVALRQTRAGELSMWKGCAAANAARNGVFAAVLAKLGMTGPSPIFEGEMGFFKQVSGEFDLNFVKGAPKVLETLIKRHPVEYHAMSAVDAALAVKQKIGESKIKSVTIDTFTVAWKIIAKDPEKWAPKTKETADHSLPFIVCRALLDGFVWLDTFLDWKIRDKEVEDLLSRTKVSVDPAFDSLYPQATPNRVTVVTEDGKSVSEEVVYPVGHYKNPMADDVLEEKYLRLGGPKDALRTLWALDKRNVKEIIEAIRP